MCDISGFEGLYAVTSCGKVWSYRTKKFLKPMSDRDGYLKVGLYDKEGHFKCRLVHRLVAEAYVPNPEGKPTVNHLDEVKTHNWCRNLTWATQAEQNAYGTRLQKIRKPVICVETGVFYESARAAAAAVDGDPSSITKCVKGKVKTHKKFHWRYATEAEVAAKLDLMLLELEDSIM